LKNKFYPVMEDPVNLFNEWLKEAVSLEPSNPNACALATANKIGKPSVRMVLLKGADEHGFVFYTNYGSRKGVELSENPHASLCFHWKSLSREVRVEGHVEKVPDEESDLYFQSRARASKIGAWASKQSRVLDSQLELERRVAKFDTKFKTGKIERPEFWGGYRIKHEKVEFWTERKFRLHDRLVYSRYDQGWQTNKLFP